MLVRIYKNTQRSCTGCSLKQKSGPWSIGKHWHHRMRYRLESSKWVIDMIEKGGYQKSYKTDIISVIIRQKKDKCNKPHVFKTRFSSLLTQTSDLFALTLIYMYVCRKWWATPGTHLIFRWRVGTSPWPVCCQYYFRWRLDLEFPPVELLRVCNILPFTMLHIINFTLAKFLHIPVT